MDFFREETGGIRRLGTSSTGLESRESLEEEYGGNTLMNIALNARN